MIQILGILIALAGLSVLLCTLERLFSSVRGQPLWRQDSNVDVLYWLFMPLVTRTILRIVGLACVLIMFAALDRQVVARLAEGFGPVTSQPVWLLSMEVLLLGDLIGYWTHRWFHRRRLWKFHAVHHSSTQLDWLSALRVHPVNDVVSKLVPAVLLACLGFPLQVLAGYVALLTFYTILLHANLDWSYGPLRYVVASPLFHRWHHTTEEQGLNKNFAPFVPAGGPAVRHVLHAEPPAAGALWDEHGRGPRDLPGATAIPVPGRRQRCGQRRYGEPGAGGCGGPKFSER